MPARAQEAFPPAVGYAISAKRYALYSQIGNELRIEKASGHGLGYLFLPKERKREEEDEETPEWVLEAWEFLLRKALIKAAFKRPEMARLTDHDANGRYYA